MDQIEDTKCDWDPIDEKYSLETQLRIGF
jgi:hypothetical protein